VRRTSGRVQETRHGRQETRQTTNRVETLASLSRQTFIIPFWDLARARPQVPARADSQLI
jgi:hypothetical protein